MNYNPEPSQRDNLIMEWQRAEQELAAIKEREMTLRKQVMEVCFPDAEIGTNTLELGKGYKLKGVRKQNFTLKNSDGETEAALEVIAKMGNEGTFIAERLVGWNPKLSLTEYNKLEATDPTHIKIKAIIDGVLTISDATPSVEVVAPKAK